ncbi:MAG: immunoglobulin domain-containing protein [Limisphaerales bacterium]
MTSVTNRLYLSAGVLAPIHTRTWVVLDYASNGVPTTISGTNLLGPDDVLLLEDAVDGSIIGDQPGRLLRNNNLIPSDATNAAVYFYLWDVQLPLAQSPTFRPTNGDKFGLFKIVPKAPVGIGNYEWFVFEDVFADRYTVGGGGGTLPVITGEPEDETVTAGETAAFTVTATGNPAPNYQWFRQGTNYPGATLPTLAITNAQLADAGDYSVIVANSAGSVTSRVARLTVNLPLVPPTITEQPIPLTVTAGEPASFRVTATGTPPLAYQWFKDGTNLAGATTDTYSIPSVTTNDAGSYQVRVSNSANSTNSVPASLTVNAVSGILLSVTQGGSNVLQFSWTGGTPPFQLLSRSNIAEGAWTSLLQTSNRLAEVTVSNSPAFFVIQD